MLVSVLFWFIWDCIKCIYDFFGKIDGWYIFIVYCCYGNDSLLEGVWNVLKVGFFIFFSVVDVISKYYNINS